MSTYQSHNIWEHSAEVRELYTRRAHDEAEEMTCAQQAVSLLLPFISAGDTVVDAGCGSGYFFHSLRRRHIPVTYYGFDHSPTLINIGRQVLPAFGLPAEHLSILRLDDYEGAFDHTICMNVLSNIDNYHRPLERLLNSTSKTLILRESLSDYAQYQYVQDRFLDDGVTLNVHVNVYDKQDVAKFIERYGFEVTFAEDWRAKGQPEMVIDYPHYWSFIVARRL